VKLLYPGPVVRAEMLIVIYDPVHWLFYAGRKDEL
jgi:hypothetical protein